MAIGLKKKSMKKTTKKIKTNPARLSLHGVSGKSERISIPIMLFKKAVFHDSVDYQIRQQWQDKFAKMAEKGVDEEDVRQTIAIDMSRLCREILYNILGLARNQPDLKQKLVTFLFKGKNPLEAELDSIYDFVAAFNAVVDDVDGFNCEIPLNGHWYPVIFNCNIHNSFFSGEIAMLKGEVLFVDQKKNFNYHFSSSSFCDDRGYRRTMTLQQILKEMGVRLIQQDLNKYKELLHKSIKVNSDYCGKMMNATGPAMMQFNASFWTMFEPKDFGTKTSPRKVIVESVLEKNDEDHYNWWENNGSTPLPYVRAFSLDLKRYVYIDIRNLEEYDYDNKAIDRLVLPENMRGIFQKIFDYNCKNFFGDLIKGKSGGMVILANGSTGVGKTLTAEVFAEHTKRPLYVMEMGELGTNLENVENNLRVIFERATRWNAVLLFDEADIFMSKREPQDLDRSAIVGVFLRLLDYYPGLLFLTTNRKEVIDPAFMSRIALALDYPALDLKARMSIWKNLFIMADVTVKSDYAENEVLEILGAHELNGRQIRNMVRLAKVISGNGVVTIEQLNEIIGFKANQ